MSQLRFTTLVEAPLTVAFDVARVLGRPWPRPLEEVTLADVVAGKLPASVTELAAIEDAWRSFGDASAG